MIWLCVPYREKDEAKALGARWDRHRRSWYLPEGVLLTPFERWLPTKAQENDLLLEVLDERNAKPPRYFNRREAERPGKVTVYRYPRDRAEIPIVGQVWSEDAPWSGTAEEDRLQVEANTRAIAFLEAQKRSARHGQRHNA